MSHNDSNKRARAGDGRPTNRPSVPAFGQFSFPVAPPRPSQPLLGPVPDAELKHKAVVKRRAKELESDFSGYKSHGGKFVAPYDRISAECVDAGCEVQHGAYYQAIIRWHTNGEVGAAGDFRQSNVKLYVDNCAIVPGVAIRFHDSTTESQQQLNFDMSEVENVEAAIFDYGQDAGLSGELDALLKMRNVARYKTWNSFFRIKFTRKDKNIDKDPADYSSFNDTPHNWTPTDKDAAGPHAKFEPYAPQTLGVSGEILQSYSRVCSAKDIEIWAALPDGNKRYWDTFERYHDIIAKVARCGRHDKFAVDWYWSKHSLYTTPEEFSTAEATEGNCAKYFGGFVDSSKQATDVRMFPERPPWLQKEPKKSPAQAQQKSHQYCDVWDKSVLKTRYSGPLEYRCVQVPATLWSMEANAQKYTQQFSTTEQYAASFQCRGIDTRVRVKVHHNGGPLIKTAHDMMQIVPEPGTPVWITIMGDPEKSSHTFIGRVAQKQLAGYDFVAMCPTPSAYQWIDETLRAVTVRAIYSNHQDELAVTAINKAAAVTEHERRSPLPLPKGGRLPFRISNHTGGQHVKAKSRDFYGDWCARMQRQPGFSEIDNLVRNIVPGFLNVAQKQAYLLALRGVRGAEMGVQGRPGTGKSRTLMSIAVAMMLIDYTVCINAQSDNGADAVFEKIASWVELFRPAWATEGKLLRLGASTDERATIAHLVKQKGELDEYASSISRGSMEYSTASKIATHIFSNPADVGAQNWLRWNDKFEKQYNTSAVGTSTRPPQDDEKFSKVTGGILGKVIGKPRLIAATAEALNWDDIMAGIVAKMGADNGFDVLIFNDASQATEASFVLSLTAESIKGCGLVVLAGDHKQPPPVTGSLDENPFGTILQISPLERLGEAYHDRSVVQLVQK